jgi:hypothetical protein
MLVSIPLQAPDPQAFASCRRVQLLICIKAAAMSRYYHRDASWVFRTATEKAFFTNNSSAAALAPALA